MPTWYEIPLFGSPQRFAVTLAKQGSTTGETVSYAMTFQYRDTTAAGGCGWTVDIFDATGNPILCGAPLVTGADLLGQFAYLDLGGHLGVTSEGAPDALPTFDNLGSGSHLWWITLP